MSLEKKLFERLKRFAVFAGKFSLPYYGKVETRYKTIEIAQKLRESPVTVIDHAIQDLLLAELVRKEMNHVSFNGEEETHLRFFFPQKHSTGITLHCDPIDGTAAFISGKNRFAVGIGLSSAKKGVHDFFSTVIYSPIEKKLYWSFKKEMSNQPRNQFPPRTLAAKHFFNEAGKERLKRMGYSFVNPGSGHLGVIDVALGKMGGITGRDIDVHDALIPYSFAKNAGLLPFDEQGNGLKKFEMEYGPQGFPRIPKIIYLANKEIKDELIPILSNPKFTI